MISAILASWTPTVGLIGWIVILIVLIVVFVIPILLIILFVRYVLRSNRERQRLRLELGKLADELEQMRKQKESNEKT